MTQQTDEVMYNSFIFIFAELLFVCENVKSDPLVKCKDASKIVIVWSHSLNAKVTIKSYYFPFRLFNLAIMVYLVWKPNYNRAIVEQRIKSSWSAGVCVCSCDYTGKQGVSSRYTIQLLPKA